MTTEPFVITAGALLRRTVRRALQGATVPFTEDAGLCDSQFTVLPRSEMERIAVVRWFEKTKKAWEER